MRRGSRNTEKSAKYLNKKWEDSRLRQSRGLGQNSRNGRVEYHRESIISDSDTGLKDKELGKRVESLNETLEAALVKTRS